MIGLPIALRITLCVLCLGLFFIILRLIGQGRLQIRYSLLWMLLGILMLLCVIFPEGVSILSGFFGFEYSSNFIFSAGLIVLLIIALSLSMVASWQARYIRHLVQTVALLDNRLSKLEQDEASASEQVQVQPEVEQTEIDDC